MIVIGWALLSAVMAAARKIASQACGLGDSRRPSLAPGKTVSQGIGDTDSVPVAGPQSNTYTSSTVQGLNSLRTMNNRSRSRRTVSVILRQNHIVPHPVPLLPNLGKFGNTIWHRHRSLRLKFSDITLRIMRDTSRQILSASGSGLTRWISFLAVQLSARKQVTNERFKRSDRKASPCLQLVPYGWRDVLSLSYQPHGFHHSDTTLQCHVKLAIDESDCWHSFALDKLMISKAVVVLGRATCVGENAASFSNQPNGFDFFDDPLTHKLISIARFVRVIPFKNSLHGLFAEISACALGVDSQNTVLVGWFCTRLILVQAYIKPTGAGPIVTEIAKDQEASERYLPAILCGSPPPPPTNERAEPEPSPAESCSARASRRRKSRARTSHSEVTVRLPKTKGTAASLSSRSETACRVTPGAIDESKTAGSHVTCAQACSAQNPSVPEGFCRDNKGFVYRMDIKVHPVVVSLSPDDDDDDNDDPDEENHQDAIEGHDGNTTAVREQQYSASTGNERSAKAWRQQAQAILPPELAPAVDRPQDVPYWAMETRASGEPDDLTDVEETDALSKIQTFRDSWAWAWNCKASEDQSPLKRQMAVLEEPAGSTEEDQFEFSQPEHLLQPPQVVSQADDEARLTSSNLLVLKETLLGDFGTKAAYITGSKTLSVIFKVTKYDSREIRVLLNLPSHPGVIRVMHHYAGIGINVCLLLEDHLTTWEDIVYNFRSQVHELLVRWMVASVLNALKYVHQTGIIHLNVCPMSIVAKASGRICLRDFTQSMVARVLSHVVDPFNRGTKYYRPPETVKFGMAAPESDFFSLGVVLIESVTKKNPIAFLDEFRANEALSVDDFIHAHLQNVLEKVESSQTQAVIRELVHHSMNWRRKIADTLPHKSYLAGINWDLLNQGLSPVSIGRILDERLSSEREPPSKETKCEMELSMDSGSSGSASVGAEAVSRETANKFTLNPEASVFVPRQPSHTPSAAARPAAASSQGNFSQPLGAHSHFALNKEEDARVQNSRPSGRMAVRPRERPGLNNSAKHQTQRFYQANPRHRQGENQYTYRHLRPETNRFFRPENRRPVREPTAAGPGGRKKRHGGRRQS